MSRVEEETADGVMRAARAGRRAAVVGGALAAAAGRQLVTAGATLVPPTDPLDVLVWASDGEPVRALLRVAMATCRDAQPLARGGAIVLATEETCPATARAGVAALVRALAVELGPAGVRVNGVCAADVDAGAAAIAFLASSDAAYITGQQIQVSGRGYR